MAWSLATLFTALPSMALLLRALLMAARLSELTPLTPKLA